MSNILCVTVRFMAPDPTFHGTRDGGQPEWPPSPLRLFKPSWTPPQAAGASNRLPSMSSQPSNGLNAYEWSNNLRSRSPCGIGLSDRRAEQRFGFTSTQPFSFEVGAGQVIAGFDSGVRGMYIGQTKTVNIPAAQAYGTQKSASNPLAGQNLTFIITLDEIQPSLAREGFTVQVDYTLKLADGSVYQTTVGTGQRLSFTLGMGQVIAGFDAAVDGMNVGETKTVTIPAAQAYGTTTSASNPLAGQDLTFVITLLAINPAQ